MSETNNVVATIVKPQNDWELLIDDDSKSLQDDLESPTEDASAKIAKLASNLVSKPRRTSERGRKKPYTEDSIRI